AVFSPDGRRALPEPGGPQHVHQARAGAPRRRDARHLVSRRGIRQQVRRRAGGELRRGRPGEPRWLFRPAGAGGRGDRRWFFSPHAVGERRDGRRTLNFMPTWNSDQYLKFARERTQPAVDLAARVGLDAPARVIDLGCGPGNSTAVLTQRWPKAHVTGLDN